MATGQASHIGKSVDDDGLAQELAIEKAVETKRIPGRAWNRLAPPLCSQTQLGLE